MDYDRDVSDGEHTAWNHFRCFWSLARLSLLFSTFDSVKAGISWHTLGNTKDFHQNHKNFQCKSILTWGYNGSMPMLQSACKNISALALLALDPRHTTISPYDCMIPSISRVASAEQSVNNDTNRGTLSTFSICGWMFSIPRGNLA